MERSGTQQTVLHGAAVTRTEKLSLKFLDSSALKMQEEFPSSTAKLAAKLAASPCSRCSFKLTVVVLLSPVAAERPGTLLTKSNTFVWDSFSTLFYSL